MKVRIKNRRVTFRNRKELKEKIKESKVHLGM